MDRKFDSESGSFKSLGDVVLRSSLYFEPEKYLQLLLGNSIMYVVENFFTASDCEKVIEAFKASPHIKSQDFSPKIPAIGFTLHPTTEDSVNKVLDDIEATKSELSELYQNAGVSDPAKKILEESKEYFSSIGYKIRPMMYEGNETFFGIVRRWDTDRDEDDLVARIHEDRLQLKDNSHLESFDTFENTTVTVSTYFSNGGDGGELTIYDYKPSNNKLEEKDGKYGYGFPPSVVEGRERVTYKPKSGDLVLFTSDRLHSVKAVKEGVRLSSVFFSALKVSEEKTCIIW